jgi:hypothetical protein
MDPRKNQLGLIRSRRNAAIALCLTGFIAAQSFRAAFSHAPRNAHWLFPLDFISLPIWVIAVVNVAFYLYLVWVVAMFYRIAQRGERVVVAGWFGVILLIPLQHLVSTPAAAAIKWVKAAGMAVASIAAAYILMKSPVPAEGVTKMAKQRPLVLLAVLVTALVLGALLYFVPMR